MKGGRNVPDTKLRLTFLTSGYQSRGYTKTVQDTDLERGLIKKLVVYDRTNQKELAKDKFWSFEDERNSLGMVPGSEETGNGLWAARVLLIFRITVTKSIKCQKYGFMNYIEIAV